MTPDERRRKKDQEARTARMVAAGRFVRPCRVCGRSTRRDRVHCSPECHRKNPETVARMHHAYQMKSEQSYRRKILFAWELLATYPEGFERDAAAGIWGCRPGPEVVNKVLERLRADLGVEMRYEQGRYRFSARDRDIILRLEAAMRRSPEAPAD